jgi:hypothetical protein
MNKFEKLVLEAKPNSSSAASAQAAKGDAAAAFKQMAQTAVEPEAAPFVARLSYDMPKLQKKREELAKRLTRNISPEEKDRVSKQLAEVDKDIDAAKKRQQTVKSKGIGEPFSTERRGPAKPLIAKPMPGVPEEDYAGFAQLTYADFLIALNRSYNIKKRPFVIWGEPGIGKSAGVVEFCTAMAAAKGKIYVNIDKEDAETLDDIEANPEKYFILADLRTATMDPFDLSGVPDISGSTDKKYLTTKKQHWIHLATTPGMDGILFFDEVNQAREESQNALYKIFYDRVIFDRKIADNIGIVGAGNIGSWATNDIMKPGLVRRITPAVLVIQPNEWLKWAESKGINPLVTEFIRSNPDVYFYQRPESMTDPKAWPNPAGFEALSEYMNEITQEWEDYELANMPNDYIREIVLAAQKNCGEKWANAFREYVTSIKNFNWDEIVEDPSKYMDPSRKPLGEIMAMVSYLRQQIAALIKNLPDGATAVAPENKKKFEQLISILVNSNQDWLLVMLSKMKRDNVEQLKTFQRVATAGKYDPALAKKFQDVVNEYTSVLINATKAANAANASQKSSSYIAPAEEPTDEEETTPVDPNKVKELFGASNVEESFAKMLYKKSRAITPLLTIEEKQLLAQHPIWAYMYAVNTVNKPFPEGEKGILADGRVSKLYIERFGNKIGNAQVKFNSMVDEVIYIYENATEVAVSGNERFGIGETTPTRIVIMDIMNAIEEKFNFDWTTLAGDIDTIMKLEENYGVVEEIALSVVEKSTIPQLEKVALKNTIQQSEELLRFLMHLTCAF